MQADKRDMTGWYKLPNLELRLSAIIFSLLGVESIDKV
jgi:hypothetical protein